jgi:hypothetical protein
LHVQGCLILSQVGLLFPVNHAPMKNGVPSRTLTSNLEFRTLPLCALSYGDKNGLKWHARRVMLPVQALIYGIQSAE